MIGMSFGEFLVLLVAGVIAAAVIHYPPIAYRFLEGLDGFLAKVIAGWMGAWLGSPILGHWFEQVKFLNIYLIPALLGAFVGAFVITATGKALAKMYASRLTSRAERQDVERGLAA